jgi:hypothetical protein
MDAVHKHIDVNSYVNLMFFDILVCMLYGTYTSSMLRHHVIQYRTLGNFLSMFASTCVSHFKQLIDSTCTCLKSKPYIIVALSRPLWYTRSARYRNKIEHKNIMSWNLESGMKKNVQLMLLGYVAGETHIF